MPLVHIAVPDSSTRAGYRTLARGSVPALPREGERLTLSAHDSDDDCGLFGVVSVMHHYTVNSASLLVVPGTEHYMVVVVPIAQGSGQGSSNDEER